MKINILLNPIDNLIIGYNTIINDTDVDSPCNKIIEVNEHDSIFDNIGKCYYIDGEIVLKTDADNDEVDDFIKQIKNKEIECDTYRKLVDNEYKIFMDGVISGADMATLSKNAKENREKYSQVYGELEVLKAQYESKMYQAANNTFEQEQSEIDYKYYVSAILLIKDENQYLEEWLEDAIKIGIDHVYIYDNMSDVAVSDYLSEKENPYLDKITFIRWESTDNTQQDAYNDWLEKYGDETRWVIPYDVDEFIQINDPEINLKDYLKENEQYGYIHCQWRHYNADGHVEKPEGNVTENFTTQADWYDQPATGKKFIQTYRCACFSRYNPVLKSGCIYLDTKENTETIQLNHYFTKSLEEWTEKINRGSCDPNVRRNYRLFFQLNPDMSALDTGEDSVQGYEYQ